MAGLATNNSEGGQAQPYMTSGNRPQRNLSRRVSFNESTLKQSPQSSVLSSVQSDIEGQRNNPPPRTPRCNICCAWASIIIGTLVVIIFVVGAIFFSFFQSNMPDFHFQGLNVTKIDIATAPNSDTLLTADISVSLNATNKNGKWPVYYSSFSADLSSGDVYLGKVNFPDMEQKPHDSTELKVHTLLKNVTTNEADAKDLKKKYQNRQLLINLILGGNVHYVMNGHKMVGFPFKVLCQNIYQGLLDDGEVPKCQVKMTPVS
ncbi:hypothetical protein ACH5RR_010312 [Cinchona calisaya]|uniref:Late embryogenesis abundant protein LEA-2 subgroup domain-containing protein n=1 Tax=Cinchona calisaya TaxID=153742 RepID=A0ABD3AGL4_9GENT